MSMAEVEFCLLNEGEPEYGDANFNEQAVAANQAMDDSGEPQDSLESQTTRHARRDKTTVSLCPPLPAEGIQMSFSETNKYRHRLPVFRRMHQLLQPLLICIDARRHARSTPREVRTETSCRAKNVGSGLAKKATLVYLVVLSRTEKFENTPPVQLNWMDIDLSLADRETTTQQTS